MPIFFTPRERQYKGERCGGAQILITEWDKFDPLKLGLALAVTLRKHYEVQWKVDGVLRMLCHRASFEALMEGRDASSIEALWGKGLDQFRRIRARHLIY